MHIRAYINTCSGLRETIADSVYYVETPCFFYTKCDADTSYIGSFFLNICTTVSKNAHISDYVRSCVDNNLQEFVTCGKEVALRSIHVGCIFRELEERLQHVGIAECVLLTLVQGI